MKFKFTYEYDKYIDGSLNSEAIDMHKKLTECNNYYWILVRYRDFLEQELREIDEEGSAIEYLRAKKTLDDFDSHVWDELNRDKVEFGD